MNRRNGRARSTSVGQKLDLGQTEVPSRKLADEEQNLEEIMATLQAHRLKGTLRVRLKQGLRAVAEWVFLVATAGAGTALTAAICSHVNTPAWFTVTVALLVGAALLYFGVRYVAPPGTRRRRRRARRGKGKWS
jgi:hypothetical protein